MTRLTFLFAMSWLVLAIEPCINGQTGRVIKLGVIPDKMRYDSEWIGATPGEKLILEFHNTCRMQHNWVLCKPGKGIALRVAQAAWLMGVEAVQKAYVPDHPAVLAASPLVNPGMTVRVVVRVPEELADYPFVCTLPGHAVSMQGILHVGKAGDQAPALPEHPQVTPLPHSAVVRAKQVMRRYRPLMDGGPTVAGIFSIGKKNLGAIPSAIPVKTHRGIAVRLGNQGDAGALFDTELLRVTAFWKGGFIKFLEGREDERAEYRHQIEGVVACIMQNGTGWMSREGSWEDPRADGLGPLLKNRARYLGHYRAAQRVIFHYKVDGVDILDSPSLLYGNAFTRDLRVEPSSRILKLRMALQTGMNVSIASSPDVYLEIKDGFHQVVILPRSSKVQFQISLSPDVLPAPKPVDLDQWTKQGNRGMAGPEIITVGERGPESKTYTLDTLTLPYENPWNALLYTSGLDFFSNGDAAVCTSHGDVWTVSGIDDTLKELRWRRFATGLANPLGLCIVDDVVHVVDLHGITRFHDHDQDGAADHYATLNADIEVSGSHHRFATDLQVDSQGYFYFLKCTDEGRTSHGGSMIRVSPDGTEMELFATGLRNPNGMGMGPNDMITFGKQQGTWIPSSGLHVVQRGAFYGYIPSHHRALEPTDFQKPLCWIPHGIDNSSGGQVWVPNDQRWGPLNGQLLHFSYGKCQVFQVFHEKIDGVYQGGVVRIPGIEFESGSMRGRFRPEDGQLYVVGLRGWQTSARMPGCLQRLRYTGRPGLFPTGLKVLPDGLALKFSEPLDANKMPEKSHFAATRWQYRWTSNYGSPDFKISQPDENGRDTLEIVDVQLTPNRKAIHLKLHPFQPAMQMSLSYRVLSSQGIELKGTIYHTIHTVPPQ
jgi:hypothetical protein